MKKTELEKLGYESKDGQLNLIDENSLSGSPEKVLEAVRLAIESGLTFEPETEQVLIELAGKLGEVASGQLGPQWRAFAAIEQKRQVIELLDKLGGVESLLPELTAMKGVQQPPQWHPEGDVWIHTLLSLEYLGEADAFLTTSTLLHDVGKPPTFEVSDRIRFSKHDSLGAKMARKIALRLGFTSKESEDIEWIVGAHMRFKHVREMRPGRLRNLVLDGRFERLAAVVRADCLASHGDTADVDFTLSAREKALREASKPRPFLSGGDLIEMGFAQGPLIGEVLSQIAALRKQGKVQNTTDAKKIAKSFLKKSCKNK